MDVEIGAGVGMHAIQTALSKPHRQLYAIEKTATKFKKFETRYNSHGQPDNLHLIHGNAITWITHAVPQHAVDQYFLLYPNPNPKNIAQRFHAMPFMSQLIATMKADGKLILATNLKFYAEEAKRYLSGPWQLELLADEAVSLKTHPQFKPRSHFEKKYFLRGQTCYHLIFSK